MLTPHRPSARNRIIIGLATVALLAAACGKTNSTSSSSGSTSTTNRDTLTVAIGFSEEIDPDVYFDLESTTITSALYEGLVRYKPGTPDIEGVLAEKWEISPDGLTFTFHLRSGATFADGSAIDSKAVRAAFQRKTDVAGPPSYILKGISGYDTPDASTFVIKLEQPINNFLYRLASPWGSLITNPAVIAANEKDGDHAKGWLGSHSAGSGQYVVKDFVPDDRIVLEANSKYWGTKPTFKQVVFKIVPDTSSQQLQTEQGDVDIMAGVGPDTGAQIEAQGKVNLEAVQGYGQMFYQVNVTKAPFTDPAIGRALEQSIPYASIAKTVLGKYGRTPDQLAPPGVMPAGRAAFQPKLDAAAFKQATASVDKSTPITIGQLTPDPANIFARTNEFVAEVLRSAGFTVQIVPVVGADYFGLIAAPDKAPTLMLTNQPGDGTQPANWFDLFYRSDGALNVGGVGNAEIDQLLDAGNAVPSGQKPDYDKYEQAAEAMLATGGIIPVADLKQLFVSGTSITGLKMHLVSAPAFWISEIKKG